MGLKRGLASVFSNNSSVVLTTWNTFESSRGVERTRFYRKRFRSVHFFCLSASDVAAVLSGSSLLMIVLAVSGSFRIIVETSVVFAAAVLASLFISLTSGQILHDIVLALLVALTVCVDQEQRHRGNGARFSLSCHLLSFMFALTGIRKRGLILIFSLSEIVRVTVAAATNDWRNFLTTILTDFTCLLLGLTLYHFIFCIATEILQLHYRPRKALQDLAYLPLLELEVFNELKRYGMHQLPLLTAKDHLALLMHSAQLPRLRHQILTKLGPENAGGENAGDIARGDVAVAEKDIASQAVNVFSSSQPVLSSEQKALKGELVKPPSPPVYTSAVPTPMDTATATVEGRSQESGGLVDSAEFGVLRGGRRKTRTRTSEQRKSVRILSPEDISAATEKGAAERGDGGGAAADAEGKISNVGNTGNQSQADETARVESQGSLRKQPSRERDSTVLLGGSGVVLPPVEKSDGRKSEGRMEFVEGAVSQRGRRGRERRSTITSASPAVAVPANEASDGNRLRELRNQRLRSLSTRSNARNWILYGHLGADPSMHTTDPHTHTHTHTQSRRYRSESPKLPSPPNRIANTNTPGNASGVVEKEAPRVTDEGGVGMDEVRGRSGSRFTVGSQSQVSERTLTSTTQTTNTLVTLGRETLGPVLAPPHYQLFIGESGPSGPIRNEIPGTLGRGTVGSAFDGSRDRRGCFTGCRRRAQKVVSYFVDLIFAPNVESILQDASQAMLRTEVENSHLVSTTKFGTFRDPKLEHLFLAWKLSHLARFAHVAFHWLVFHQVLLFFCAFGISNGAFLTSLRIAMDGRRTYSDPAAPIFYYLRLFAHIVIACLVLRAIKRDGERKDFNWSLMARKHAFLLRFLGLSNLGLALIDFMVCSWHVDKLLRSFDIRTTSFMHILVLLPFYLHFTPYLYLTLISTIFVSYVIFQLACHPPKLPPVGIEGYQLFVVLVALLLSYCLVTRPFDRCLRRTFLHAALPYILYLVALKTPAYLEDELIGTGLGAEDGTGYGPRGGGFGAGGGVGVGAGGGGSGAAPAGPFGVGAGDHVGGIPAGLGELGGGVGKGAAVAYGEGVLPGARDESLNAPGGSVTGGPGEMRDSGVSGPGQGNRVAITVSVRDATDQIAVAMPLPLPPPVPLPLPLPRQSPRGSRLSQFSDRTGRRASTLSSRASAQQEIENLFLSDEESRGLAAKGKARGILASRASRKLTRIVDPILLSPRHLMGLERTGENGADEFDYLDGRSSGSESASASASDGESPNDGDASVSVPAQSKT